MTAISSTFQMETTANMLQNIIGDGQRFLRPSRVLGKEWFSVVNMASTFYDMLTFWRRIFFFQILAHPVFKM